MRSGAAIGGTIAAEIRHDEISDGLQMFKGSTIDSRRSVMRREEPADVSRKQSQSQTRHDDEIQSEVRPPPRRHGHRHKHQTVSDSGYRADIESFLERYSKSGLHSGLAESRLPRVSVANATLAWSELLDRALDEQNVRQADADQTPWLSDRPRPNRSPYDEARSLFPRELFEGAPGLVDGVAEHWPASRLWKDEASLLSRFEHLEMPLISFAYPGFLRQAHRGPETLSKYLERNESTHHNRFFFVDETQHSEPGLKAIMDSLHADVQPRPVFAAHPDERHALMAIEGAGASHGLHLHGPVWQTQVSGRKIWWLLPPDAFGEINLELNQGVPQPRVHGHLHRNACDFLQRAQPPEGAQVCVVEPGETMIVPDFWWHATCALDHVTAAMGGFFIDNRHPNGNTTVGGQPLFIAGWGAPGS